MTPQQERACSIARQACASALNTACSSAQFASFGSAHASAAATSKVSSVLAGLLKNSSRVHLIALRRATTGAELIHHPAVPPVRCIDSSAPTSAATAANTPP